MIKYNRDTPILLLVFNRPLFTAQVFDRIRSVAPRKLYIAADGPRNDEELLICNEVKEIIGKVDWDCEVRTLFREKNLGCGKAVSEAITWFFIEEEQGIILEDDCLPDLSFFAFTSTLLAYFSNDNRIGHISGSNFQDGIIRGDGSYYYSGLTHVWGWASWRRVWKDYDFRISSFNKIDRTLNAFPSHKPFWSNWNDIFTRVSNGEIDTWDYQYAYLNLTMGYKSIMPNANLIKNIGMGSIGTHDMIDHPLSGSDLKSISKIVHPTFIIQDVEADIYTQNREFYVEIERKGFLSRFWKRIKYRN